MKALTQSQRDKLNDFLGQFRMGWPLLPRPLRARLFAQRIDWHTIQDCLTQAAMLAAAKWQEIEGGRSFNAFISYCQLRAAYKLTRTKPKKKLPAGQLVSDPPGRDYHPIPQVEPELQDAVNHLATGGKLVEVGGVKTQRRLRKCAAFVTTRESGPISETPQRSRSRPTAPGA